MIDSHHHLWRYSPAEYPWIPAESPLAADQLVPELEAATSVAGIIGTVAVQARQTLAESDFLLDLAEQTTRILGVVGWVPLIDDDVERHLARLAANRRFVGVRHVLQDEPDDYFIRDDFHRGLALLPRDRLRYDLLIFQRQIPAAIRLADRQPKLEMIIDHIAKPAIRPGRVEPEWRRSMRELAEREHVTGVKLSGVATEFPADQTVDVATLRAYFETTLEIFGIERVMFGSDWPVCLLRMESYAAWVEIVRELVSELSPGEQDAILTTNARRIYGLANP